MKLSYFNVRESYSQFFQKCSWYTFEFCNIEFERNVGTNMFHIIFIIFGVGFSAGFDLGDSESRKDLERRAKDRFRKVYEPESE